MVSEHPHLSVVKDTKEPSQEAFPKKSEEVFPKIEAVVPAVKELCDEFEQKLSEYRLEVLKLRHQRELQEAHLHMSETKLRTTFELLLQEALTNGVPYSYIEGAHTEATDVLESLSEKVG